MSSSWIRDTMRMMRMMRNDKEWWKDVFDKQLWTNENMETLNRRRSELLFMRRGGRRYKPLLGGRSARDSRLLSWSANRRAYEEVRGRQVPAGHDGLADAWVVAVVQSSISGDERNRRWPFTQKGLRSAYVHKGQAAKAYDPNAKSFKYVRIFGQITMFGFEGGGAG